MIRPISPATLREIFDTPADTGALQALRGGESKLRAVCVFVAVFCAVFLPALIF